MKMVSIDPPRDITHGIAIREPTLPKELDPASKITVDGPLSIACSDPSPTENIRAAK